MHSLNHLCNSLVIASSFLLKSPSTQCNNPCSLHTDYSPHPNPNPPAPMLRLLGLHSFIQKSLCVLSKQIYTSPPLHLSHIPPPHFTNIFSSSLILFLSLTYALTLDHKPQAKQILLLLV